MIEFSWSRFASQPTNTRDALLERIDVHVEYLAEQSRENNDLTLAVV
jgi:hypothetical protein